MELPEVLISDAILEEVIAGVMNDIRTWLLAQKRVIYGAWTDISLTPLAIRRAATYGAVASLYARGFYGPEAQVIVSASPISYKVISSDDRAMEYWEDKMEEMLELYMNAAAGERFWVSTQDEEAVFSMDDIP